MDLVTHIALGACMGEAMLGRRLGKKAMLWGALAHSFPDVDVISALWLDTPEALLAHRGITHSIAGGIIAVIFFSWLAMRFNKQGKVKLDNWVLFFCIAVLLHPLIDTFNTYGVGWFEPFDQRRISFNTVYVADPLFSAVPIFAAIALIFIHQKSMLRKVWWRVAFIVTGIYLVTCVTTKTIVEHDVKEELDKQEISYNRYFTAPAPFQNMLWYVVAATDSGYYVGYRSVFDRSAISFHYFPANRYLLSGYTDQHEIDLLSRFSQQWYTVEQWHDTLVFNDLRFGQIAGWKDSAAHFSFHYFLGDSLSNRYVMQRGRVKGWTGESINRYFKRIVGN
jgi:inner membrane protein